MASTHTYTVLPVSSQAFQEIKEKLEEAGYDHAIQHTDGDLVIDMHGIALSEEDD